MSKTDNSQLANKRHFYGRRKGHTLSQRQKTLLERRLPKFELSLDGDNCINLNEHFTNGKNPLWLEIGFGKGEHLVEQAKNNPDINFIGCEPFVNGVVGLLDLIENSNLANIRIYPDDARDVMVHLPEASVEKVFLLHPDPWPKRKHEARRFIGRENLCFLANIMKDGAELRVGTDHAHYARWVMFQIYKNNDFTWIADSVASWKQRPDDWPETRYQQKAAKAGINPVYLKFKRDPR